MLPSGYDSSSRLDPSINKNGPGLPHGRMSPPPSYDEVVFNVGNIDKTKKSINDNLDSSGNKNNVINIHPNEFKSLSSKAY